MRRVRTPTSLRRVSDFIVLYLQVLIFFRRGDAKIVPNSMCRKNKSLSSLRKHGMHELLAKGP